LVANIRYKAEGLARNEVKVRLLQEREQKERYANIDGTEKV
jgi:hypothetical protein